MAAPAWVERWRALLPQGGGAAGRVSQGRAFQRSGRVASLRVEPGRLSGSVQGSRPTPYQVEVLLGVLDEDAWRALVRVVAGQVRFAAALLAGQLPDGLLEALDEAGIDLVDPGGELDARCACGEAARPCAHLVALWEHAAERFGEDPFALTALRGRGRQRLLAELLAVRRRDADEAGEVALRDLPAGAWTRAREPLEGTILPREEAAADPLRLMGDPPGWAGATSAEELFRPLVDRAVRRARDDFGA